MLFRYEREGATWVDLENPTPDELRDVARDLEFGGRILDELLSPSPLPVTLHEGRVTLLVLHFPSASVVDGRAAEQEVDFVVGTQYVLTVRYDVVVPLHELRKILEVSTLMGGKEPMGADALLELIFNRLYENVRNEISQSSMHLEKVGRDMFDNSHRGISNMVRAISEMSRELLHLEASIARQSDALTLFLNELERNEVFGVTFHVRAKRILAQHQHTNRAIATLRSVAIELRETNVSLLNATQNEIMKTLTILAFITFPLSLISSIFAMDAVSRPIIGQTGDFWIILSIMATLTACFFCYFKYKRWI